MSSPRGATSSTRPSPNTGWRMRSPTLNGASTFTRPSLGSRRLRSSRLEAAPSALAEKREHLDRLALAQIDARHAFADGAEDLVAQALAPGRHLLYGKRGRLLRAEQNDLVAY